MRRFSAATLLSWLFSVYILLIYTPTGGGQALFPHIDKVGHVLLFGLLGWCALQDGYRMKSVSGYLLVWAITSELLQHFLTTTRHGDPFDMLADLFGAGLAMIAFHQYRVRLLTN